MNQETKMIFYGIFEKKKIYKQICLRERERDDTANNQNDYFSRIFCFNSETIVVYEETFCVCVYVCVRIILIISIVVDLFMATITNGSFSSFLFYFFSLIKIFQASDIWLDYMKFRVLSNRVMNRKQFSYRLTNEQMFVDYFKQKNSMSW